MQGDLQGWLMRLKAVTLTVQWSVNKVVTIAKGWTYILQTQNFSHARRQKRREGRVNPYSHTVIWRHLFSRQLMQVRWTHLGKHSKPACHRRHSVAPQPTSWGVCRDGS